MGYKLSFLHHKKFLAVIFIEVVVLCMLYKYNFFSFLLDHEVALAGGSVPRVVGWNGLFALPLVGREQMRRYYREVAPDVWCFNLGTEPQPPPQSSCTCLPAWGGSDCGIPAVISSALNHSQAPPALHRRRRPRRLIYSVVVLTNPELLVLAAEEYAELVDVYLVGVAPSLQAAFQTSGLASLPNVISLPLTANRTYTRLQDDLWEAGWHNLTDFRPDDLLIFTEESAIPAKDLLLFLKLYSGFCDPLTTEFHHLQRSFRWQAQDKALINATAKTTVVTFQFFQQLCSLRPSKIYDGSFRSHSAAHAFLKHHGPFSDWVVGSNRPEDFPAGWTCHLCTAPPQETPRSPNSTAPTKKPSLQLLLPYEPASNLSVPYTLYQNTRFLPLAST